MTANPLKSRLLANEPCFMFGVRMSRTVNVVSLAEAAGYHGIYVDLQHSSMSVDTAAQIFVTALHSRVTAIARVPGLEPGLIARLLDSGAAGILAPDIRDAADAKALTEAALVAPRGTRSVAAGIPNPRLSGVPFQELPLAINAATLLIATIETEEAAGSAAEIISVDGIDALNIGSNDLTTSMGIPGQYRHERVMTVYQEVLQACRSVGKPLIIGGIRKAEDLEPLLRMGAARFYLTGSDGMFMHDGAARSIADAKALDSALLA